MTAQTEVRVRKRIDQPVEVECPNCKEWSVWDEICLWDPREHAGKPERMLMRCQFCAEYFEARTRPSGGLIVNTSETEEFLGKL